MNNESECHAVWYEKWQFHPHASGLSLINAESIAIQILMR